MKQQFKLQLCVTTNVLLLVCLTIFVIFFGNTNNDKNTYMKFGPNDNLNILGVKIDTWNKYYLLQVVLCIFQVADTIIQEFANPILGFNIYNPDK